MYLEPASVSACSVVATTTSANLLAVYNKNNKKFNKFYKYNNSYTLGTRTGKDKLLLINY